MKFKAKHFGFLNDSSVTRPQLCLWTLKFIVQLN